MKITAYPEVVQTPCALVEDPASVALNVSDMIEFVRENRGLGLAAPQIGDFRTYFVAMIGLKPLIAINPVLTSIGGKQTSYEGCYSISGKQYRVTRPRKVRLTYVTLTGQKQDVILSGLDAAIAEHEIHHLQGKCIADIGREVKR
jgi:peptide deformylase